MNLLNGTASGVRRDSSHVRALICARQSTLGAETRPDYATNTHKPSQAPTGRHALSRPHASESNQKINQCPVSTIARSNHHKCQTFYSDLYFTVQREI